MELAALPGDIKGRLVAFQMKFLAPMMVNFDACIKIPYCGAKLQKVSEFHNFHQIRPAAWRGGGRSDVDGDSGRGQGLEPATQ